MENASKALIIAATVLLAVMIMTAMVYVFGAGAEVNKKYDEKQSQAQLQLFNQQFENYNVENNTIIDLITVANLAYSTNESNEYDRDRKIKIEIKIGTKVYSIPDEKPSDDIGYARNKIVCNDKAISIYDLVDKTLKDPEVLDVTFEGSSGDDKLSLTKLIRENGKETTIYKYLFKCTSIKYNDVLGRVSYMKFEVYTDNDSSHNW